MNTRHILLVLMLLLSACTPTLEREDVPVSFSLRLDSRIEFPVLATDFATVRQAGARTVYLEMMLEQNPETRLPKFNRTALVQLPQVLALAKEHQLQVGLIVAHSEIFPLFPGDSAGCPVPAWFAKYRTELADMLGRCQGTALQRIVIGTEFGPVEGETAQWDSLLAWVRTQTPAPLVYTRFVGSLSHPPDLWRRVDEIGLAYEAAPDGNTKRACRDWNTRAGALAREMGKPVFISGANLLMQEKDLQFQNRLRFWEEDVRLSGLNINCIYTVTALTDTSQYFALPPGSPEREVVEGYIR